jgi:hypothetical protein
MMGSSLRDFIGAPGTQFSRFDWRVRVAIAVLIVLTMVVDIPSM